MVQRVLDRMSTYEYTHTVGPYAYGRTIRVWSDRTSILIRSGPYAYGPNTRMVWNIYTFLIICRVTWVVDSVTPINVSITLIALSTRHTDTPSHRITTTGPGDTITSIVTTIAPVKLITV